jgi:hypothetical protein
MMMLRAAFHSKLQVIAEYGPCLSPAAVDAMGYAVHIQCLASAT